MKTKTLTILLSISLLLTASVSAQQTNIGDMINPVTEAGIFRDADYFNWGSSIIKGEDDKYHMFYARWPREYGFGAWLTHSELAHAVSDNPCGPYKYVETALKGRDDRKYWDYITAHNPKIKFFEGKYYLYYIGTNLGRKGLSEKKLIEAAGLTTRNKTRLALRENQRTGVAVSESLNGPWERLDKPIVEPYGPITTLTVNPAISKGSDGKYYLIIKGDKPNETKFIRNQAIAVAPSPTGPFKIQDKPVIDNLDTEDVSMWFDKKQNRFYAVFHAHTYIGMMTSPDGLNWEKAEYYEITKKKILLKDGSFLEPDRMERPFVYIENGIPKALTLGAKKGDDSFSLIVPLKEPAKLSDYVSSKDLYNYVDILASEEFEGRLTGHEGYDKSAEWLIEHFKSWGVQPLGENGTFLQKFPHPYTDIFEGCELIMHSAEGDKQYEYVEEYIPGSTSGNGELKAEVVYVGYGITAPELGYDDYEGLDVKGKIVLIDREVPMGTTHEIFQKWRKYSFHQYKIKNAVEHGAAGFLYNYHIANPNNDYYENILYSHIGSAVMEDIFRDTGKDHSDIIGKIKKELKPQSFNTGKTFTIKNLTKHHPDAVGSNVIGFIEGSDPILKNEYIMIGGHLDHLGKCYTTMPGANDNASAVSVSMGIAKAMSETGIKLKRSVVFILLGAEEAGLKGVQYFLKNPTMPSLDNIKAYINMDAVGIGNRFSFGFGKNYPDFFAYIDKANKEHTKLEISAGKSSNLGRPRLDAAFFDWYGIPVLSLASRGTREESKNYRYHTPYDNISNITPEYMLNLTELLFHAIVDMGNDDKLEIKRGEIKHEFIK